MMPLYTYFINVQLKTIKALNIL